MPFTAATTGAALWRTASNGVTSWWASPSTTEFGSSRTPRSSPPGANTSPVPVRISAVGSLRAFTHSTARLIP
jgi:hypothetical protein